MYHLVNNLTNKSGDALAGYYVQLKNAAGLIEPIYADASMTPILTTSGVADTMVTDALGQYSCYVNDGDYTIEFFDKNDANLFLKRVTGVPMYGMASAADALLAQDARLEATQAATAAVAAQAGAQDAAEQAVSTVAGVSAALAAGTVSDLVGTRIYTTRALLDADLTPAADLYALVMGDATAANNDLYKKVGATGTGSWSGPLGFFASASAEVNTTIGVTASQGIIPATDGDYTVGAGLTVISPTAISTTGFVSELAVFSVSAGAAKLVLVSISGGNATLQASVDVTLAAGANLFTLPNFGVKAQAGWYVGVYSAAALVRYTAGAGSSFYYTTGVPGTSTAVTTAGSALLRIGWKIATGILGETARAQAAEAALQAQATANAGVATTQGVAPALGAGAAGAGLSYIESIPASAAGTVTQVRLYSRTAGKVTLFVASLATNTATLLAQRTFDVVVGVNTITGFNPAIAAGQYVGVYGAALQIDYRAASGISLRSCSGMIGGGVLGATSSMPVSNSNLQLELEWTIISGVTGAQTRANGAEAQLQEQITGSTVAQGDSSASVTALSAGVTTFPELPISVAGRLSSITVHSIAATPGKLVLATKNGSNQFTLVDSLDVTLAVGANTFRWPKDVVAGQYLGLYAATGFGLPYASTGGPGVRYTTGVPGTNTASSLVGSWLGKIAWTVATGIEPKSNATSATVLGLMASTAAVTTAGYGLLTTADNSGATDSATAFAAAIAAHPAPYVPAGNYLVSTLPRSGAGFWGPGKVYVGSALASAVRFPIPPAPRDSALLLDMRSKLGRLVGSGSPLVAVGDSLSAHFNATALSKHWLNKLEDWLNLGSAPGSEPGCSVFMDNAPIGETAAFYGLTVSGATALDSGPLGKAITLADGGYIEFTGAYATVEVFYNRTVGGGTLTRTYNGGASGSAVSTAGAASPDLLSAFGATGQASSGTYRITASGGTVEVTGLTRLAAQLAAPAPAAMRVMRQAYGGYSTINSGATGFTDARLDSIFRQAKALGPEPEYLFGLMTNDCYFGSTAATIDATRTSGSDTLTGMAVTDDITVGAAITGTGIPGGTTVAAVLSASSIQLSANASSSGTGPVSITLSRAGAFRFNMRRIIRRTKAGGAPSRIGWIIPGKPKFSSWGSYLASGESFETYVGAVERVAEQEGGVYLVRLDRIDFEGEGLLAADNLHWTDAAQDRVLDAVVTSRLAS